MAGRAASWMGTSRVSLPSEAARMARSERTFSSTSPGSKVMNFSAILARKASISARTSGMSMTWLMGKEG